LKSCNVPVCQKTTLAQSTGITNFQSLKIFNSNFGFLVFIEADIILEAECYD